MMVEWRHALVPGGLSRSLPRHSAPADVVAMALRIDKLTGTTPELWVNMQRNHDLRVQAVKDADVLARIPTLRRLEALPTTHAPSLQAAAVF